LQIPRFIVKINLKVSLKEDLLKESDLFLPLKKYLEAQGYEVRSELASCDLLAFKGEELLAVELKTAFSLALVYQGLERKERCDSVYLAIPLKDGRRSPPNFSSMQKLCRSLGLGLILLRFLKRSTRVEVVLHPGEYKARQNKRGRQHILKEIEGRYAELTLGGISSREEHFSAYRQEALLCAGFLGRLGQASPAQLRALGLGSKTQSILSRNVYGWFCKKARGLYELSDAGQIILERYKDTLKTLETAALKKGKIKTRIFSE